MFLVIPLVEFLCVLGVDIDLHHENPATFLCHLSVSSMKRAASALAHLVDTLSSRPEPRRDTKHQPRSHLSRHPPDPGAVERDLPSHRGTPQRNSGAPSLVRSQSFGLLASKPFPWVYPASRPLQGPLSPYLTVPSSIKSGGEDDKWKRVKAGRQRFYRRR